MKTETTNRNRVPFSKRLFWTFFLLFLGFIACFLLFQYEREKEFNEEKLNNVLSSCNYQLFRKCIKSDNVQTTVKEFLADIPLQDLRVTIIDPTGRVLFDNSVADELDNHNDRSEVKMARLQHEGFAIRSSASTGKRYFYSATNIGGYIYRSALAYDPYVRGVLKVNKDFLYFLSMMTVIYFFVLSHFTTSIGKTISRLRDFARTAEKEQMPDLDYVFPNDELGDISQHIVTLYHQQQRAKYALSMEREKLVNHFQYAKEGFAMFDADGHEILSNSLFIQFMNIISDRQLHDVEEAIEMPDLKPIKSFLHDDHPEFNRKKKVLRNTLTIDKNGKIFQVECILFIDRTYELSIDDISRQEEESRMKRELTQNISHELKTPVSSIQGFLETLLANPELDGEQRSFFLQRCYSQSMRLSGLLRDISVLNRLDEASSLFERSKVDIVKMIQEIERECSQEMEIKHITSELALPGNPTIIGNTSLLYSIFRNLYDNAIAYAGEGVKITVNCYKEDSKFYYFSFSDNGVGIAPEHINRIFERFYRVDKGRSRKMGGTGLGLSIVKNSVHFHKGQISVKSRPGEGVTFFFTLKKEL
mgnify:FL=1